MNIDCVTSFLDTTGSDHEEILGKQFGKFFSDNSHCSAELNELSAALANAQVEMGTPILKGKDRYILEDFDSVIKASRLALVKNGLAITQLPLRDDEGYKILRTVLLHKSGQWVSAYDSFSDPDWEERDPLKYLTFLRMKSYIAIVGLAIK